MLYQLHSQYHKEIVYKKQRARYYIKYQLLNLGTTLRQYDRYSYMAITTANI